MVRMGGKDGWSHRTIHTTVTDTVIHTVTHTAGDVIADSLYNPFNPFQVERCDANGTQTYAVAAPGDQ